MVQGESWGLHGFFSTFRLACSNLRQENEEVWRCSSLSSICWDYVLNGKCSDWCPVECVGCYRCGVMCYLFLNPDPNNDPPAAGINPCGKGYSYWFNTGSCFQIIFESKEFSDAAKACQKLGSKVTLASLNDPYEAAYADALMQAAAANPDGTIDKEQPLWIGMMDDKVKTWSEGRSHVDLGRSHLEWGNLLKC